MSDIQLIDWTHSDWIAYIKTTLDIIKTKINSDSDSKKTFKNKTKTILLCDVWCLTISSPFLFLIRSVKYDRFRRICWYACF
jgi:hypothetical protein